MKTKKRFFSRLALGLLSLQVFSSVGAPVKANAESIDGTVTWSNSNTSFISGIKDGEPFSDWVTPLYLNGKVAFCVEPGVIINSENESGYVGNPANGNLPRRAVLTMNLWDTVLDKDSLNDRKIAQAIMWENLEGSNKFVADEIGGISKAELKAKKDKLNEAITNYDKKPSFNGKTINLKYGVTTEVANTTVGMDLKDFDTLVGNTANVDVEVQKDKLLLTPKSNSKPSGSIAFKKSFNEGTPYVYRKKGQQAVALGGIDDPNNFVLKVNVELSGDVKIVKTSLDGTPVPNTKFKVEFQGTNAPKAQTITTGNDGSYTIKDVPEGVKVIATEISVPSPYILDSSNGGSDVVEGVAKVGETITLTKKNDVAKGQIVIDKSGKESGKNPWNNKYTLEGNVFDIREGSAEGKVIQTVTTDKNGHAESAKNLPLGTYWVTEKQASVGFVNTFEPQKVEITYKNQTAPVVISTAKGTNQEVKGQIVIDKSGKESGKDLWNSNYTLEGNVFDIREGSAEGKVIQTVTTDKNGHAETTKDLRLGTYWVTEKQASVGFVNSFEPQKVEITHKDQTVPVVISTAKGTNQEVKGRIVVDKSGKESGKDLWNSNYTLEGNVFDIREVSAEGKVVRTITTNTKGHAETAKDLPLGTYWVTEKQASNGFVNTFEPQKVEITYKDQTVAIITEETKGTNQEVVGETILLKEDSETGNDTQGRATFKGAEYGLFYSNGEPVKWTDNFKPELALGDKANEENIVVKITDETQQAQIKHLALGEYYWQETKAPEGYQKDLTKHVVKLTYKDQSTEVIVKDVKSKENVIKFNFGGFKYVTSKNGSTQSGYNGITFTLTPIDPTKGEVQSVETKTDKNGYDGAWDFLNIPYGDYKFEEVEAPEGFKLIAPLIINSKYDEANQKYTFTITEEGQKQPIKVVNVDENDIHEGSNVIQLSKLFLYDDTIPEEEPPMIETLFINKDGEQEIDPTKDQTLTDKVSNRVGKSKVGKELTYLTQFHKIDKDGKDSVVGEVTTTQTVEEVEFEFEVPFEYKADTLKDGEKLVATHIVYDDKEMTKEYTKHFDLENEKQTIVAKLPEKAQIETLFILKDGAKENEEPVQVIDPTVDNQLIDIVKTKVGKEKIGKELTFFTQFHKIDKDGKDSVVGEVTTTQTVEEVEFEFEVPFEYKADTLKDGEKLVATHIVYEDKEMTKEYAKHFDLKNEKQTILAEEPEQPEIETLFILKDGAKENEKPVQVIDPTVDNQLIDIVKTKVGKEKIGKELTFFTQFHKIDKDGKDSVVGEVTTTQTVEEVEFEFEVPFEYKADTLKGSEKLVATHIVYDDKEMTKEYAKHFDLKNEKQTIVAEEPEQPEIETLFVAENGEQIIDPRKDQTLTDKVKTKIGKNMVDKELIYLTQFHKIDKDGKDSVVGEVKIVKQSSVTEFVFDVPFEYKANTLKDGEKIVATHIVYEDKEMTKEYAKHFDLKNEKQTIVAKTPKENKPEEKPETPKEDKPDLPKTGQEVKSFAVLGTLILTGVGAYLFLRKKSA